MVGLANTRISADHAYKSPWSLVQSQDSRENYPYIIDFRGI